MRHGIFFLFQSILVITTLVHSAPSSSSSKKINGGGKKRKINNILVPDTISTDFDDDDTGSLFDFSPEDDIVMKTEKQHPEEVKRSRSHSLSIDDLTDENIPPPIFKEFSSVFSDSKFKVVTPSSVASLSMSPAPGCPKESNPQVISSKPVIIERIVEIIRSGQGGDLDSLPEITFPLNSIVVSLGKDSFCPLMHLAAINDNSEAIGWLTKKNCSVNATTNDGISPLHAAARAGRIKAVETLIRIGANPFTVAPYGITAFMGAVSKGNVAMVELFLKMINPQDYGRLLNAVDLNGITVLELAYIGNIQLTNSVLIPHNNYQIFRGLLKIYPSILKIDPLFVMRLFQHDIMRFRLLALAYPKEAYVAVKMIDVNLVIFAVKMRDLELLALLHDKVGVPYNTFDMFDRKGYAPIHMAASLGFMEIVEFYLEKGVPHDLLSTFSNETPLQVAKVHNKDEIVSLLTEQDIFIFSLLTTESESETESK